MRKYLFSLLGVIIGSILLTSCQKQNTAKQDVSRFVETLENVAKTPKKEHIEKKNGVIPVFYEGEKYRDPFELPASVKNVKQYPNTILRDMSLDSLRLVGVVLHKEQRWAIFRASNGKVYKMTEGMRVGIQQALLIEIKQDQVKFMIDVTTEAGEKPREVVMSVQEPS